MHLIQNGLCPAVAVSIDRIKGLFLFQKYVVHRPGVDGQAFDGGVLCKSRFDALFHVGKQAVDVPFQVAVHPPDTVREAVDFLGLQGSVLHPADDMPPGRCADVDGEKFFVHSAPPSVSFRYQYSGPEKRIPSAKVTHSL